MIKEREGAWIPWEIAISLPKISLRPSSRWRVFMAVLIVWCRFGRREARLGIADICRMTDLKERTVKAALASLIKMGLVRRVGRYKRLAIIPEELSKLTGSTSPMPAITDNKPGTLGGADKRAPRKGTHGRTSPNTINVSEIKNKVSTGFTQKQLATIRDVRDKTAELLGSDPFALTIPTSFAAALGMPAGITYTAALQTIGSNDRALARLFVGAVLALREDPRVAGIELF